MRNQLRPSLPSSRHIVTERVTRLTAACARLRNIRPSKTGVQYLALRASALKPEPPQRQAAWTETTTQSSQLLLHQPKLLPNNPVHHPLGQKHRQRPVHE